MKKASNYDVINHSFVESKKYTFETKKIREELLLNIDKNDIVLNLFSGNSTIGHDRIDLDNQNATCKMDVNDWLDIHKIERYDVIIIDPPFSKDKYNLYGKIFNGNYGKWFIEIKRKASKLLAVGGKMIILGYSAEGMAANWGYNNERLYIYTLGAMRPSFFMSISKKIEDGKEEFRWRNESK